MTASGEAAARGTGRDVLLAWELGSGLGHVYRLRAIGDALSDAGYRIVYALLRPVEAGDGRAREDIQVPLIAPVAPDPKRAVANYGELLHHYGFGKREQITRLLDGWRERYAYFRPRLVIVDHAPGAVLGARAAGIPVVRVGTGFSVPPTGTPWPLFDSARAELAARARQAEDEALGHVNAALGAAGEAPLERLQDMLDGVAGEFLTTFEELDHYPGRRDGHYCGPLTGSRGAPPAWPEKPGAPRVFAYLDAGDPHFRASLAQLADSRAAVLVYAADAAPTIVRHYAGRGLAFASQPVDGLRACTDADAVVCHAGHTTVLHTLLAGRPLVMLPRFLEQAMTAARVVGLGAGERADPLRSSSQVGAALARVLEAPAREAARAFAARHAGHDARRALTAVVQACRGILDSSC